MVENKHHYETHFTREALLGQFILSAQRRRSGSEDNSYHSAEQEFKQ